MLHCNIIYRGRLRSQRSGGCMLRKTTAAEGELGPCCATVAPGCANASARERNCGTEAGYVQPLPLQIAAGRSSLDRVVIADFGSRLR